MRVLSRLVAGLASVLIGMFLLVGLVLALVIWVPIALALKLFGVQARSPRFFRRATFGSSYPGHPPPADSKADAHNDVIDVTSEVISSTPRDQ